MPDLVVHIGRIFDRARDFNAQKPAKTFSQIGQLFVTIVSATPRLFARVA